MKTLHYAVRCLFSLALVSAFVAFSYAGPGIQYWQTLHKESDYQKLKPGEHIAYVCTQCKSVSEGVVASPDQAMSICKEGAKVTCPACKMTTKVVVKGKHNDPSTTREIIYVNDKGEECAFRAKIVENNP